MNFVWIFQFSTFSNTVLRSPENSLVTTLVFLAMSSSENILVPPPPNRARRGLSSKVSRVSSLVSRNRSCPGRWTIFLPLTFGAGCCRIDRFFISSRKNGYQRYRFIETLTGKKTANKSIIVSKSIGNFLEESKNNTHYKS